MQFWNVWEGVEGVEELPHLLETDVLLAVEGAQVVMLK
jgi:hypothetical protein